VDEFEKNVIKSALAWYRYTLRAGDYLSIEEKSLFNAVFEMQNKVKNPIEVLNKDKQRDLIEKSKNYKEE